MKLLSFVAFTFWFIGFSYSQNPGILFQVTPRGVNLARQVATEELTTAIRRLRISRLGGSSARLTNLRVTSFQPGTTRAFTSGRNVFNVQLSGASISATAKFRASKRIIFKFTAKGTARMTASRINIRVPLILSRNSKRKPRLTPGRCTAKIGKFSYRTSGNILAQLLDLLRGLLKGLVRREIEKQICPSLTRFLNDFNSRELARLNTNFGFPYSKINLDLVRSPGVINNGLIVGFRGQCFDRELGSPPRSPFSARRLRENTKTTKMAYITISDYVSDTLLHTMWQDKRFDRRFSSDRLLSTSNIPSVVSNLLPRNLRSRARYTLEVEARSAPTSTFSTRGIELNFPIAIKFSIESTRGQQNFIINLNVRVLGSLRVRSGRLSGNLQTLEISTPSNRLKGVEKNYLLSFLNRTIRNFIVPILNEIAESGFKFPEYFDYRLRRPQIEHENGYILIGSDFTHS